MRFPDNISIIFGFFFFIRSDHEFKDPMIQIRSAQRSSFHFSLSSHYPSNAPYPRHHTSTSITFEYNFVEVLRGDVPETTRAISDCRLSSGMRMSYQGIQPSHHLVSDHDVRLFGTTIFLHSIPNSPPHPRHHFIRTLKWSDPRRMLKWCNSPTGRAQVQKIFSESFQFCQFVASSSGRSTWWDLLRPPSFHYYRPWALHFLMTMVATWWEITTI